MPQKIYCGDVIIKDLKTGQNQTVQGVIFNEQDDNSNEILRSRVLRKFKMKDWKQYRIEKLCIETAIYLGITAY